MLKRIWQKIILEQKGQTLPIVLILMLIGGLLVVPTLNYASTSLKAKQVTEKKTLELYAADAGVEEALSYLPQLVDNWWDGPPGGTPDPVGPWEWPKTPPKDHWERGESYEINGKTVFPVTVRQEGPEESPYYNITSTAGVVGGSNTTVTSYVGFTDFSCLFDNLVTTQGEDINVQGNPGITGDLVKNYEGPWPTADYLSAFYWRDVEGLESFGPSIDINGRKNIGPGYSEGSLSIDNTGDPDTLQLDGTVYVTGDLTFEQPGTAHEYTLDLNWKTIYVKGNIIFSSGCTLLGPGCIIAEEKIFSKPGMEMTPTDTFIFFMSVNNEVDIHPNAAFTGAIAAAGDVSLYSGAGNYTHTTAPDALKSSFLGGTDAPITILSWQIS